MKLLGMMILLSAALPVYAQDADVQKSFDEANHRYEKGETEEAYEAYHGLARRGFGGVPLFYNLGNVHYRRGERGRAVLWYERAARLAPRDSDVRFNLLLARSHIKSEQESVLRRAATYFTQNELAGAASIFSVAFFTLLGLLTLGRIKGEIWPGVALVFTGSVLLISGGWLGLRVYLDNQPQAIVVSPPGEVRNGPGDDYAVGFTVPEGSRVLVLSTRPEWIQVGVPEQGLKGWLPSTEVEAITPATS